MKAEDACFSLMTLNRNLVVDIDSYTSNRSKCSCTALVNFSNGAKTSLEASIACMHILI